MELYSSLSTIIDIINIYDVKYRFDTNPIYNWDSRTYDHTIYHIIINLSEGVQLSIQTNPKMAYSFAETALLNKYGLLISNETLGYIDIQRFKNYDEMKEHLEQVFGYYDIKLRE